MEQIFTGWSVWLLLAALFVVVELLTGTFACFCLVGGCIAAFVAAALGFDLSVQLACAAVGTVVCFIAFRPLMRRHREAMGNNDNPSNMDALLGRTAFITEPIPENGLGRLKIDGDNWQARSSDGSPLSQGTRVCVTGYDSIVLIVEQSNVE